MKLCEMRVQPAISSDSCSSGFDFLLSDFGAEFYDSLHNNLENNILFCTDYVYIKQSTLVLIL